MLTFFLIIWSMLVLFFATAALAIRTASRTRLTELLKGRTSNEQLNRFFVMQGDYINAAMAYQHLCIILFVLTMIAYVKMTELWYWQSIMVSLICVPWILVLDVGIPTAWARYAGDHYLSRFFPLLEPVRKTSLPMLWIVNFVDELVRRLVGAPVAGPDQSEQIEREIMDAVRHGEISGAVDPSEKAMIKSVMVLDETSVGEIMTPRTDMVGIEIHSDHAKVRELVLSDGHSRIPVYEDSIDHIVGILFAKDLLGVTNPSSFSLQETMREVTIVPETKDLASLLREFQANQIHLAIVLDEYGGTAGLVTFEDILEELVGEITDEHEAPPTPALRRINERTAEIDARMRVEELNDALGTSLPEDESYDTVGGFVFSQMGRIPTIGESMTAANVRIEILEAQERNVDRLRIHLMDSDTTHEKQTWP